MRRSEWISIIAVGIILASVIILCFYYYENRYRECTSNPLVFAAKMYEEHYNSQFIGMGWFAHPKSPTIYFSSHNVTINPHPES